MQNPIYVTQPYLPPLAEFIPYLMKIWDSKILTNGGPFHQRIEGELCRYLGVKHLALFTNGTLALVTALQALRITGEVITTLIHSWPRRIHLSFARSARWNLSLPLCGVHSLMDAGASGFAFPRTERGEDNPEFLSCPLVIFSKSLWMLIFVTSRVFTFWVRSLRPRLSYWRRVWGCCSTLKAQALRVVAPTQTCRQ